MKLYSCFILALLAMFVSSHLLAQGQMQIAAPAQAARVIPVGDKQELVLDIINQSNDATPLENIHAILPDDWQDVQQRSEHCFWLPVGHHCSLHLTAKGPHLPGEIQIVSDNPAQALSTWVAFSYAGGLVYALQDNHVLVVEDRSTDERWPWVIGHFIITSTIDAYLGKMNTLGIVAIQGPGSYAANHCLENNAGGYSDWYLPAVCQWSHNEFDYGPYYCDKSKPDIYGQLHRRGFGHFDRGLYWTSTEYLENFPGEAAMAVGTINGAHAIASKNTRFFVRCVREADLFKNSG